jgi:hypothetical protein
MAQLSISSIERFPAKLSGRWVIFFVCEFIPNFQRAGNLPGNYSAAAFL